MTPELVFNVKLKVNIELKVNLRNIFNLCHTLIVTNFILPKQSSFMPKLDQTATAGHVTKTTLPFPACLKLIKCEQR